MFECMACEKVTEEIDYCFGCGGFLCFECDHQE